MTSAFGIGRDTDQGGGDGPPKDMSSAPTEQHPESPKVRRFRLGDPLSIVLIVVILVSMSTAGLIGAELYARHRADSVVAAATECAVQDKADVSFGGKPFLLQHLTGHYGNILITTAGNQIRNAKLMKAQVRIDDVRLQGTADSKGTIGALDATVTWSSDGINQTVQNSIPLFGSFLSNVTTNPSDGTIELHGVLGSITAKPQLGDNGVGLRVVRLSGLGFTLPSESVQPALDAFAHELTDNYPLGVHADSVRVTDSGVVGHYSARNAPIPRDDRCFANL
jgi:LmeA-like phospholipid-binding